MSVPAVAAPTRRAAAEQTRARLLDAAVRLFASSGTGVSFAAIAADVGVTKGALYHHFGSKERLVEEVFKEAIRRHADQVIAASAQGTGRERLLTVIEASGRLYGSATPFYRLLTRLHLEAATSRPHLAPIARRVQGHQREYMTELARAGQADGSIRPDLDPEAVGLAVNAALQGFVSDVLEPPAVHRGWVEQYRTLMERTL